MFVTARFAVLALIGAIPVALLGLAGVPVLVSAGGWAGLCAIVVVVDVLLAASPQRVSATRRAPARAMRGEPIPVLLELQNLGTRPVRGGVRDGWPQRAQARPNGHSSRSSWARITARPGERIRVALSLTPKRRGLLRSDAVAVRSLGPFGLAGRQAGLPLPGEVAVSWNARGVLRRASPESGNGSRLDAALPRISGDPHHETVHAAYEELLLLAALYGGRTAPSAPVRGGLFGANIDRIANQLPSVVADRSGRLVPLLDRLAELFSRARQQDDPQQLRLLVARYADTLTKLASLLSEQYYGDLLRNPDYWSEPQLRIAEVKNAIAAVDQEVLENIQQLSESRDIEFGVALDSLTRFQRSAKLSDAYGDPAPDPRG